MLNDYWSLADAQSELRFGSSTPSTIELRTSRVSSTRLVRSSLAADTKRPAPSSLPRHLAPRWDKRQPYSMVTGCRAPWTPADLRDDEIVRRPMAR